MKIVNGVLIKVYDVDIKDGTFIIPNGVNSISKLAFSDCYSLESIVLPDSLTSIGKIKILI